MSTYQEQLRCAPADIDLDFWRAPEGVAIPDDELRFLLVPDAVEAAAVFEVAQQVHTYQRSAKTPISRAVMATMGGLLPGILLHDHLAKAGLPGVPPIEFGTIGVSLYKGPDERHEELEVVQALSVPVDNEVVLLVDDLGDRGDTMRYLKEYITVRGAREVLTLMLYMKPRATEVCPADFSFGVLEQDTWIITPRESVETLTSRVPVWKARGASLEECERRLVELIGYSPALVAYYLESVYRAAD